jgi:rRNA processing protein Gar1
LGQNGYVNKWHDAQLSVKYKSRGVQSTNNWQDTQCRQSNSRVVAENLQTIGKIHSADRQTVEWWQRIYKQLARYTVQTVKCESCGRESTYNWQDTQCRQANTRVVAGSLQTIGKIHSADSQTRELWQRVYKQLARYTVQTVKRESDDSELPM